MGHTPAGPKSVSISVSDCCFLPHALLLAPLVPPAFSHSPKHSNTPLCCPLSCHFSLFGVSVAYSFAWEYCFWGLSVAESRPKPARLSFCLCTAASCCLRAGSDFVIVLKLQTRAAHARIPDKFPLFPLKDFLFCLYFFQIWKNHGVLNKQTKKN